mmetsp:Transcript_70970/g.154213  ORF Transcript_70970/g.154213 Transcript_70970/m.154213 type:complete len:516 (-) Transcript_70970:163-1710(-)
MDEDDQPFAAKLSDRRYPVHLQVPLLKDNFALALTWDSLTPGLELDLDLQCVIADKKGRILDAVHGSNRKALNGCVAGPVDGFLKGASNYQQMIWAQLSQMPASVRLIIFVLAAGNGCRLADVDNIKLVVLEEAYGHRLKEFSVSVAGIADTQVIALVKRCKDGSWTLRHSEEPGDIPGSHFLDILEPTIGDIIRQHIPHAPKEQKVTFRMEEDAMVDLRRAENLTRLSVGIGGVLKRNYKSLDIDISAYFFTGDLNHIGVVGPDSEAMYGVEHFGDRGGPPDQALSINLQEIPDEVSHIFVVLTACHGTLEMVETAYARLCDQSGGELAIFDINGSQHLSGLILARLLRRPKNHWAFHAAGIFVHKEELATELGKMLALSLDPRAAQRLRTETALMAVDPSPLLAGNSEDEPTAPDMAAGERSKRLQRFPTEAALDTEAKTQSEPTVATVQRAMPGTTSVSICKGRLILTRTSSAEPKTLDTTDAVVFDESREPEQTGRSQDCLPLCCGRSGGR